MVHIGIFNQKGEMLIQQRQSTKKDWADMWDVTVGGSAIAGETSRMAAEREVAEEIGIQLSLDRPALTIHFNFSRAYATTVPVMSLDNVVHRTDSGTSLKTD